MGRKSRVMLHCRIGWRRGSPSWEALHAAACPSVQRDCRAHLLEECWSPDDQVSSLHAAEFVSTARQPSLKQEELPEACLSV